MTNRAVDIAHSRYICFCLVQVSELESEITIRQRHLSQVTGERDSLLAQLESTSSQLSDVETALNLEKTNSNKLQVRAVSSMPTDMTAQK